jgi:hypothetical protein
MSCQPYQKKKHKWLDDEKLRYLMNSSGMANLQRLRILESVVLSERRKIHTASSATALLLRRSALRLF